MFPIDLPPLGERTQDIPLLVRHFVVEFGRRLGRRIESIPHEVMETLVRHPWPGNVRELQHVVHRAVILSHGGSLQLPALEAPVKIPRTSAPHPETFDDAVRALIVAVLRETNGVVAGPRGAAVRLGLKRSTLVSKMEKLGISPGTSSRPGHAFRSRRRGRSPSDQPATETTMAWPIVPAAIEVAAPMMKSPAPPAATLATTARLPDETTRTTAPAATRACQRSDSSSAVSSG